MESRAFRDSLKVDGKRKRDSEVVRGLFIRRLRNNLKGQARFIQEEIFIDEDDRKEGVLIVQRLLQELERIEHETDKNDARKENIER